MNTFRTSLALSGLLCLSVMLCPVTGHAQQTRTRPAARPTPTPGPRARPTASPIAKPTPTPTIIPAAPADPELKEQAPPSDAAPDAAPENETQIDASEGATFASKDRIATFNGNVRVNDPRFQLSCDKLTVFLNKSTPPPTTDAGAVGTAGAATPAANGGTPAPLAAGNTPPPAASPAASPAAKGQGGGGGIDHCVAEGHVIILQKRAPTKPGEEEKVSIGRGEKGTFDNKSGDMTLYGMPEIEQNGNSHSATSPDTVMVIHRDSSLTTTGPNTTHLIQHKGGSGLELPGVPATDTGSGGKKKNKPNGAAPAASPAASRASGQ